jgi:hypothetical protein
VIKNKKISESEFRKSKCNEGRFVGLSDWGRVDFVGFEVGRL